MGLRVGIVFYHVFKHYPDLLYVYLPRSYFTDMNCIVQCSYFTDIYRVPVKCEVKRNETKPMETKRNETKRIFSKTKCKKKMKNSIWHED
jgi:hypothetical protein